MAEIPVTKMGLVKKYGADVGSFIWKHLKEGTGFGELHSSQVTKRIRDLAAKAKKLEDDAIYAAKDKGPRDVLLKLKRSLRQLNMFLIQRQGRG